MGQRLLNHQKPHKAKAFSVADERLLM